MRLVWYQRPDGLWNAACACDATIAGIAFERRTETENKHFGQAEVERRLRAAHPAHAHRQLSACGPKLPEPNPNHPGPLVFP